MSKSNNHPIIDQNLLFYRKIGKVDPKERANFSSPKIGELRSLTQSRVVKSFPKDNLSSNVYKKESPVWIAISRKNFFAKGILKSFDVKYLKSKEDLEKFRTNEVEKNLRDGNKKHWEDELKKIEKKDSKLLKIEHFKVEITEIINIPIGNTPNQIGFKCIDSTELSNYIPV